MYMQRIPAARIDRASCAIFRVRVRARKKKGAWHEEVKRDLLTDSPRFTGWLTRYIPGDV